MLGTMRIHDGDLILDSARMQLGQEETAQADEGDKSVHEYLQSASMLKSSQLYLDLMKDVPGYCGAFEDG